MSDVWDFALDGVSALSKGVHLIEYKLPLSAKRDREEEILPGRMTALTSEYASMAPAELRLTLAVLGDDTGVAATLKCFREARRYLWTGTRLTLSFLPGWYDGEVTQLSQPKQLNEGFMTFELTFRCNPPWAQRAISKQDGWAPDKESPAAEQITAQTETESVRLTAAGTLPKVTLTGMEAPETHLKITGTFGSLTIGSLALAYAAAQETTVCLDVENQVAYALIAGERVSLMASLSGDFDGIDPEKGIAIGGEGLDITARLLVIERG